MKTKTTLSADLPIQKAKWLRTFLILSLSFTGITGFAQTDDLPQHSRTTNIELKEASLTEKSGNRVIEESITEPGATWLQLSFKDVELGENSIMTITAEEDGAVQTFDAESIAEYDNKSAYFNGNALNISIEIADGDNGVGATVDQLKVGENLDGIAYSQCGPEDNRVASNAQAIGRLGPTGCTGWIITNGKLVTAGHCIGNINIIMFNVPKSNPNRTLVFPAPRDQYPITGFINGEDQPGNQDWAVLTAGRNSQTGLTPIQGQNRAFNVTRDNPAGSIRITGYGTDTGVDNQTQQTHVGRTLDFNNERIRYVTDTEGGNSGSPVVDSSGNALGVHTNGGCNSVGGNKGTRATVPAFWNAMGLGSNPNPNPNPDNALRIEAENFVDMNGIQTEPSSEGGLNVGFTDPGDWMAYGNITFPQSGNYLIEYRVASAIGGSGFSTDINAGGTVLGAINVPNTGGWQNWTTVSHTVSVNAGTYPLGIYTTSGGYNLNWFRISTAAGAAVAESVPSTTTGTAILSLYPNPARNTVSLDGLETGETIQIFDMQGHVVLETEAREDIDIQSLNPGVYLVRSEGKEAIKLIKE